MTRAPAAITSSTWEPSLAKSADRIDGATRGAAISSRKRSLMRRSLPVGSRRFEHADAPQVWHCMSAVWVIRAIVWCSPHSGHWETSSKRLRQLTQRRRPGSWVGRSQGSPQFGHGARSRTLLTPVPGSAIRLIMPGQSAGCRVSRLMKKPVVRSRSGRSCRARGSCGEARPGARAPRSSSSSGGAWPGGARLRAAPRSDPRSRGARSCRSSRPACRPAAAASPRRAAPSPAPRRPARSSAAICASARRGARRACRGPSRARRGGSGRSPRAAARLVASASITVTPWRSRRSGLGGDSRRRGPRRARSRSPRRGPPSGARSGRS